MTRTETLRLAEALGERLGGAEVAVVLGSGLGAFADALEDARELRFDEVRAMPRSAVPGHAGRWVRGTLRGRAVLVQQGRSHFYEGFTAPEVTRAVRAYAELGCRALVLTNSAGGLHADWPAGRLMAVRDQLDWLARPVLERGEGRRGVVYDPRGVELLRRTARALDVPLEVGVYAGLPGPAYETPAEIRCLASFGADAVGMSTVAEAAAARVRGLLVAGVSCISNPAAGITDRPLSHDDVLRAAAAAAPDTVRLLRAAVPDLLDLEPGDREP